MPRNVCFAVALMMAAAGATHAESPKASIKGPTTLEAGSTVVLDARASVADRPLRWKLEGPDVPFLILDQDGRKGVIALIPAAPSGVYKLTLIAVGTPAGETVPDADAAMLVINVTEPLPPPAPVDPPPAPTPTPGPAPTPEPSNPISVGTLHATLVVDLDAITPDQATLRIGVATREAFKKLDAIYRTFGSNSPDLVAARLTPYVTRAGLPCLIVQDMKGNVLLADRAPATETDLITAVQRLRGVK